MNSTVPMNSTAPDPETWEGINMAPMFSPFYWGTVVSLILSGITFLQAYNYFPSKDRLPIRILAAVMISLDIASTALISQGLYYYMVPHFGSLIPLETIVPTLSVECALSILIIFLSQCYFAWQISAVNGTGSRRFIIPALVMIFSVTSFAGGIGCVTVMFIDRTQILTNRTYRFNVLAGIAKGSSAVADVIATVTLCIQLGTSRTGVKQTDVLVKTLMQYVIQRGLTVTLIQTALLIIFFATASHAYWIALHVNVTRLYANTFFAMLNGRHALKKKQSPAGVISTFASGNNSTYPGTSFTVATPGVKSFNSSDDDVHSTTEVTIEKQVVTQAI